MVDQFPTKGPTIGGQCQRRKALIEQNQQEFADSSGELSLLT